jgi:hypothetical protein
MNVLGKQVDERFLQHRLWSTSISGTAGGVLAMLLFLYHNWFDHVWNWELLAVGITMATVKVTLMTWYHFKH